MADDTYQPFATKEDLQALRADLTKYIGDAEAHLIGTMGSLETRLTERIGRLEGQFSIIIRLNYFMAASLLAMAVKVIFFPTP